MNLVQTLPSVLCGSQRSLCLRLQCPPMQGGDAIRKERALRHCFVNRTWLWALSADGRKEDICAWIFHPVKEETQWKAVDALMMGDLRTNGWISGSWRKCLCWECVGPIHQLWRGLGEAIPRQPVEMNLDNCSNVSVYKQGSWDMSLIYKE